jgi:hypothetical protein
MMINELDNQQSGQNKPTSQDQEKWIAAPQNVVYGGTDLPTYTNLPPKSFKTALIAIYV